MEAFYGSLACMMRSLLTSILLAILPAALGQPKGAVPAEADPARLEAILAARNLPDLNRFVSVFINSGASPSPELEAVVARYVGDAQFEMPLLTMIGDARISYTTLALNRALAGVLDKVIANDTSYYRIGHIRKVLVATVKTRVAGTEQPLLDRIDRLPQEPGAFSESNQGIVVEFLARRKYEPAVPYLSSRLLALPPDGGVHRGEAGALLSAIARIQGEPAAVPIVARRFEQLAAMPYLPSMQTEMTSLFAYLHRNGMQFSNARLAALLRDKPADDTFAVRLTETLARRTDKEATDVVLARLESLSRTSPKSSRDLEAALRAFEALPDQSVVDYERLRRALPAQMSSAAADLHLRYLQRRSDPRAAGDVPASYIGLGGLDVRSVERILESESPAQWREARDRLEALHRQNKIDPGLYRSLAAQLDRALANPPAQIALGRQRVLARTFEAERGNVTSLRIQANKARGTPEWPGRMEALIDASEALEKKYSGAAVAGASELRSELRTSYHHLAIYVRFVQRDPAKAIELHGRAARYDDTAHGKGFFEDILIADVYQFDLRSAPQALQRYDAAAAKIAAGDASGGEAWTMQSRGWRAWIAREAAFLRTGRRFSGEIAQNEAGTLFFAALLLTEDDPLGAPRHAAQLDGLAPSRVSLARALRLLPTLPERDVLRHLERHDPSGYWSACILGMVPMVDRLMNGPDADRARRELSGSLPGFTSPGSGIRSASARFLAERKIVVKLE
jgi:hypothetical protein